MVCAVDKMFWLSGVRFHTGKIVQGSLEQDRESKMELDHCSYKLLCDKQTRSIILY